MVALPRWLKFWDRGTRADFNTIWMNPDAWTPTSSFGSARATSSGEAVTDEKAMGLSAYYACIRNGSDDVAKLPRRMYRKRGDKRGGGDPVDDHAVSRLLKLPNPIQTWGVFCRLMQMRRMGWGNGYAEIVRDGTGAPLELWPLHPERVRPVLATGVLTYEVTEDGGAKVVLGARDVFHIKGMGDGLAGYSLFRAAAETLGIGLAAQRQAGEFYSSGMGKQMVAFVKGPTLDAAARAALRNRIVGDRERDPNGVRKLKIIDGLEVDLRDAGINPDEAQFLESREFTVEEIARFCRMPLSKIQYHKRAQGWSSLDALNTDYVVDFILPNIQTWEEEIWFKLLTEDERDTHYVKWVVQGLLRGDSASRTTYFNAGLQNGWLSPNDVRGFEDLPPIDDDAADQYRTQMQMVPLAMPDDDEDDPEPPPVTETFTPFPTPEPEEAEEDPPAEEEPPADPKAAFLEAVEQLRPTVEATCRRQVRLEISAATRAMTKHACNAGAFSAWSEKFYAEHAEAVADAMAPIGAMLEWGAGRLGLCGVGAGAALLAIVPTYRAAVTPADDEARRVTVLSDAVVLALTKDVTVKEAPRA